MEEKAKTSNEQEPQPEKVKVRQLQEMYPDLMALPREVADELAVKVLRIMARRGECMVVSPLTGKLTADQREIRKILDGGYDEVILTNL